MMNKNITKLFTLVSILLIAACGMPAKANTINVTKMPGFNPANATKALQAALDSGADKVIVPNVGQPWVVTPIELRSNQTVVFRPGVVILAKKGSFKGVGDSLFTARNTSNLNIIGYGATWRMRKKDYTKPPYKKAEWRMGLKILGGTNITIEGLSIEKTGGDGIYIGTEQKHYSKNITIRNVILSDNYRQGISVISVDGLLIENTIMRGTDGTPPAAGIDFEPNSADQQLTNIVMRNCLTWGNQGHGYEMYLVKLNAKSKPVSIRFENCRSIGDGRNAVGITTAPTVAKAPKGQVTFNNCEFKGSIKSGIMISKPAKALNITFRNCVLEQSGVTQKNSYPIEFVSKKNMISAVGGVNFDHIKIIDPLHRQPVGYTSASNLAPLQNITGTLLLINGMNIHKLALTPKLLKEWSPKQKFTPVSYIPLSEIKGLTLNTQSLKGLIQLGKAKIRWGADYALYAREGDHVQIALRYGKVAKHTGKPMPVSITGPEGKQVLKTTLHFQKTSTVKFTAPADGLYHITAKSGRNFVRLESSTNVAALMTPPDGAVIHKSKATYYLWVPKGTDQFAVRGKDTHSKNFRMILSRPDSTVAKEADNVDKDGSAIQITAQPTPDQTGKIWTLKLLPTSDSSYGDYRITLLGIPPLLAVSSKAVIKSK